MTLQERCGLLSRVSAMKGGRKSAIGLEFKTKRLAALRDGLFVAAVAGSAKILERGVADWRPPYIVVFYRAATRRLSGSR